MSAEQKTRRQHNLNIICAEVAVDGKLAFEYPDVSPGTQIGVLHVEGSFRPVVVDANHILMVQTVIPRPVGDTEYHSVQRTPASPEETHGLRNTLPLEDDSVYYE